MRGENLMQKFWHRMLGLWQRKIFRLMVYSGLGMFLFVFALDAWIMPWYTRHGQAVQLPDVTRMLYEDARAKLTAAGFKIVREEERFDSQVPGGHIIEQNPKPGALVKPGRRVYVIISRGEQKIPMPELTDISEREAMLKLQRLGLAVGDKSYEPSSYYFEGVVMHQSIAPGVEVPRGTRVDLTISIGNVADEVVVPLVEGRSLDDARQKLAQSGLKIGTITYQEAASLLPETVIKQSVLAGTVISRQEPIDLVVSALPRGGVNN